MNSNKKIVLAGLLIMELMAAFDNTGVTVMVPTLQTYFNIPANIAGWVLIAYLLPFSLLLVPMGWIADTISKPEKVITWSILTFSLTSALCGLSVNEFMLIACRFIKGISAAGMFACEFAIILKYWEEPRRAVEIVITGLALGVLIGPAVGGLFSQPEDWRYFFIIGSVLALLGFIAYQWINKLEPIERKADKLKIEKQPFSQKARILVNLLFWGMLLNLIISVAAQGTNLLITLQVQEALHKTPIYNSIILVVLSLGMVVANAIGIGNRLFKNTQTAVLASGAIFGITLILLATFTNWIEPTAFIFYFLMGIALGIFISTIELMALNPLPTSLLAQGNGWIVSSMQAGFGLGSFLTPILFIYLKENTAYPLAGLVLFGIFLFKLFKKN